MVRQVARAWQPTGGRLLLCQSACPTRTRHARAGGVAAYNGHRAALESCGRDPNTWRGAGIESSRKRRAWTLPSHVEKTEVEGGQRWGRGGLRDSRFLVIPCSSPPHRRLYPALLRHRKGSCVFKTLLLQERKKIRNRTPQLRICRARGSGKDPAS